jgi:hypothetical protein
MRSINYRSIIEKYDISDDFWWYREEMEDALTPIISNRDLISRVKYPREFELIRLQSYLEWYPPKAYTGMKKPRKPYPYPPLPIKMRKRYTRFIVKKNPTTSDNEKIRSSNEPDIVEKISNISEKMFPDTIGKIRYKSYSITTDDSTRRIIGTDSDLCIAPVSLLEIFDLSLEDELISEIVCSSRTHDEDVLGLSRKHTEMISEIVQYAKISCFFRFFRILRYMCKSHKVTG